MTDPQTGVALAAKAGAAMCVRSVDDQGVLQFTLILAAGCVLHRRTSRVIHRQELFLGLLISHSREILSCLPNTRTCAKKDNGGAPASV